MKIGDVVILDNQINTPVTLSIADVTLPSQVGTKNNKVCMQVLTGPQLKNTETLSLFTPKKEDSDENSNNMAESHYNANSPLDTNKNDTIEFGETLDETESILNSQNNGSSVGLDEVAIEEFETNFEENEEINLNQNNDSEFLMDEESTLSETTDASNILDENELVMTDSEEENEDDDDDFSWDDLDDI